MTPRSSLLWFTSLTATFALAIACGGAQPSAEAPAAPASAAPVEPAPAPAPAPSAAEPAPQPSAVPAAAAPAAPAPKPAWKDLSHEQKEEIMENDVLPTMKKLFQEADAKEFSQMNCATCHGAGAKDDTFKMPNPKLPVLDPTGGFEKHKKAHPKMTQFMMERVVPKMIELLNSKPFDMQTHEGIGCGACHTFAMKAK